MPNGKEEFDANISEAMQRSRDGAVKGLKLAVALVKLESQKKTPVDTGNLRGSHKTDVQVGEKQAVGVIFLTANYAIYVHEIIDSYIRKSTGQKINYVRKSGEAKFLENAVDENKVNIHRLLHKFAKFKK